MRYLNHLLYFLLGLAAISFGIFAFLVVVWGLSAMANAGGLMTTLVTAAKYAFLVIVGTLGAGYLIFSAYSCGRQLITGEEPSDWL